VTYLLSSKKQVTRFITIGVVGNLIGLAIYAGVYSFVQIKPRAAISWFLSALIGIWKQHGLHRIFTFTDSRGPYFRSLARGYIGYSIIIISGTSFHWFIVSFIGIYHYYSWLMTKGVMLSFSFFVLRRFVFKPEII
jgi:putative flippase GtrA